MSTYETIPVNQIAPSPHQARKDFDEESLKGLAESMRREGLIQPIIVRRVASPEPKVQSQSSDSGQGTGDPGLPYELISGERRLRAAKMLYWDTIDARIIDTVSEGEAAAKGLIENLQREDLNPIEEAEGFAELNQLDSKYWNQETISNVVGKNQGYISQSITLLTLPESIKENMRRRIFSRSHGVELTRLPTKEQRLEAAAQIQDKLTAKETRDLVNRMLGSDTTKLPRHAKLVTQKETDPLESTWQELAFQGVLQLGTWHVRYQGGTKWSIDLSTDSDNSPKEELGRKLYNLGKALLGTEGNDKNIPASDAEAEVKHISDFVRKIFPKRMEELDKQSAEAEKNEAAVVAAAEQQMKELGG